MPIGNLKTEADVSRYIERIFAEQFAKVPVHRIAGVISGEFIAPPDPMLNSWVNAGGDNQTAGYMRDVMGFVHLRGEVANGTANTAIFSLPPGFRPSLNERFIVLSGLGAGVVTVQSNGFIIAPGASPATLNGISFRAEN